MKLTTEQRHRLDRFVWHLSIVLIVAGLMLCLWGCGSSAEPARGSASEHAASVNARAETTALASDQAHVEAAAKDGKARALEDAAKRDPTPARIEAAVAARVEAASATAVANALAKVAGYSAAASRAASIDARKEREADAASADLRQWVWFCRIIGLVGVVAGGVLGGLLCWIFKSALPGAPVGAGIAGLGLLVVAFGQTVTWLPLVLGGAFVLGLGLWALKHVRGQAVSVALSRTVDALNGEASVTVAEAKDKLGKAVSRAGLQDFFDRVRVGWESKDEEPTPTVVITGAGH